MTVLAFAPPLDWAGLLAFLGARSILGVEEIEGETYRRTYDSGGSAGVAAVTASPAALTVVPAVNEAIQRRSRNLFDLDADSGVIDAALTRDEILGSLVTRRPGLRVPGAFDPFETSIRAVLGQQITVSAASTMCGRVVRRTGTPLPEPRGSLTHLFPVPERLAAADLSDLGLTGARIRTLHALSEAVASGSVVLDGSQPREAVQQALLELPGIGPWTTSYISMRVLGDPDAFPASDIGIRNALSKLGLPSSPREALALAERWRPWRSYAVLHLWASLSP